MKYFVTDGKENREATSHEVYDALINRAENCGKQAKLERLLKAASKLKKEIEDCDHKVFHDEPSFIYDVRICLCCGKIIDTI